MVTLNVCQRLLIICGEKKGREEKSTIKIIIVFLALRCINGLAIVSVRYRFLNMDSLSTVCYFECGNQSLLIKIVRLLVLII